MSKLNDELFKDEKLEKAEMGKLYGGARVSKCDWTADVGRWDVTWDKDL